MVYHADANNPDRFTRKPYGAPDYLNAFFYLTDVNEKTPVRPLAIGPRLHGLLCKSVFC
jgi:hypothetical protein